MSWKFVKAGSDGDRFRVGGIDFLRQQWTAVEGRYADVKDPHFHQDFKFQVYTIDKDGVITKFAAGEFSNGYWGFYIEI
jgi:hypothetical protein